MFENWHIMRDGMNTHFCFYGDLETDFSEDELDGFTEVSDNEITVEDYIAIFNGILENNNKHSLIDLGKEVLNSFRKTFMNGKCTPEEECAFIKDFIECFVEKHKLYV